MVDFEGDGFLLPGATIHRSKGACTDRLQKTGWYKTSRFNHTLEILMPNFDPSLLSLINKYFEKSYAKQILTPALELTSNEWSRKGLEYYKLTALLQMSRDILNTINL